MSPNLIWLCVCHKKEKFRHKEMSIEKIPSERNNSHLQAEERALEQIFLSESSEEIYFANNLILTPSLQNWDIKFQLFTSSSLWYCIMAA